ncbi:MAG: sigma-70 family RNA polymerase sigma factor [Pirellulales bacterium]
MLNTTQWTVVFRAAREDRRSDRPALSQLIERYQQPLYFFARRQGLSADDAEDAVQSFLTELIEGDTLAAADPAKGRFRTYLLTLWKRFLTDRARYENRLKRGGGMAVTSLYCAEGEKAWVMWSGSSASDRVDPDRAYYQQWASTIIESVLRDLKSEYVRSGRTDVFETLLPLLTVPADAETYRSSAARMNTTEGAVKVALHRLRQRFAQALRQQVIETLDDADELESELNELKRYYLRADA